MGRTIQQKAQMEFIKNPRGVGVIDADTHIVLSLGTYGVYIEKDAALIRYEGYRKYNPVTGEIHQDRNVFPELIMERTRPATVTEELAYTKAKEIAVKLIADNGKYAYITLENLKYFGKTAEFRVENNTNAVCVTKNGNVIGVIIPEQIKEDEDE